MFLLCNNWCKINLSYLISSYLISSHLTSSHLISLHLISSHLISSHLILSHILTSHLISSYLILSYLILSYLILSYLIYVITVIHENVAIGQKAIMVFCQIWSHSSQKEINKIKYRCCQCRGKVFKYYLITKDQ